MQKKNKSLIQVLNDKTANKSAVNSIAYIFFDFKSRAIKFYLFRKKIP